MHNQIIIQYDIQEYYIKYEPSGYTQLVYNPTRALRINLPTLEYRDYLPTSYSSAGHRESFPAMSQTSGLTTNLGMSLGIMTILLPTSCRTRTNELLLRSGVVDSNVGGIGYPNHSRWQDFAEAHWDGTSHLTQRDRLTPFVSRLSAKHSLEPLGRFGQRDVTHIPVFKNCCLPIPIRLKCPVTRAI